MFEQKNGDDHSDDEDELSASDESEPEEPPSSTAFVPELEDEEEEEAEACAPAAGGGALSVFSLRGGSSAFTNRSHSIFDGLDSVARPGSSGPKQGGAVGGVSDGVFARPLPPRPSRKTSQAPPSCPTPAKKKGPPDYVVHPERWTHYSLEDVTETSDRGNRMAAHHFLSSLRQSREQQEELGGSSGDGQQRVVFSKPRRLLKEHLSPVRDKEKETHLSHLEEEEEEEELSEEKRKAGGRRKDQRDQEGNVDEETEKRPEESKQEQKREEEETEEVQPGFTSFRKSRLKNYRRSSGQEEN
ncbi:U5 small nuclear ribonucleoprotein TSSC4 [Antennarius striatus]|uniref:U5 small nuclear ribonucleoprotein TSSC4 n=1 Tax=Antennarius striatus TaxID=241820 RepID=UPI0035B14391